MEKHGPRPGICSLTPEIRPSQPLAAFDMAHHTRRHVGADGFSLPTTIGMNRTDEAEDPNAEGQIHPLSSTNSSTYG
jgi:hypothetical protein